MKKEKLLPRLNKAILFVIGFFAVNLLFLTSLLSQNQNPSRIYQIQVKAKNFLVDQLLQSYAITNDDDLVKYNPTGIKVAEYSNPELGSIGAIDVGNPFNVFVFYPDFFNIVILDNNLTEKAVINLLNFQLETVTAACLATDNNIWIFDEADTKLKKIDKQGKILSESEAMSRVLGFVPKPKAIDEVEQNVYVLDENGILIFDSFGHFIELIPETKVEYMQVLNGKLVYSKMKEVFVRNLKGIDTKPVPLNIDTSFFKKFIIRKDRMYILNEEGVDVFLKTN